MRTNSGTSGTGAGGAVATEAKALVDVLSSPSGEGCYLAAEGHICDCEMTQQECTDKPGAWTPQCDCPTGFVADEMLPIPGPPGSESSANPVLAEWFDYDMETHVLTKSCVHRKNGFRRLREATGTGLPRRQLTIDWAYAGPGHTTF